MLALLSTAVLGASASRGDELPDTSYCWPKVIVRSAENGRPVRGDVAIYRVRTVSDGACRVAKHWRTPQTSEDGTLAIDALFPALYLVHVGGVAERRALPNWSPPEPTHPMQIVVGRDPSRCPEQVREFSEWQAWTVNHGNCLDSLVITVRPREWVTLTECRHIFTWDPAPSGYRFER